MCAVLWGNFKQKKAQEKADLITISPERQGDNTTHHENTEEVIVNCRYRKKNVFVGMYYVSSDDRPRQLD